MTSGSDTSTPQWRAAVGLAALTTTAAANQSPMPYQDAFDLEAATIRLIADVLHYADGRRALDSPGLPDSLALLHAGRAQYIRELNRSHGQPADLRQLP